MSVPGRSGVCAVIVTWNPDLERLTKVVEALSPQANGVVIVDNGSGNFDEVSSRWSAHDNTHVIGLPENLGIGAALNVGVEHALLAHPAWVLTMDQDTLVDDGAIEGILSSYATLDANTQDRCAILALRPHPQPASIWLTRYAEHLMIVRELGLFIERRGVITSGNLVKADVAERVHFNESLFIDQVDFDFCFSLRHLGYLVIQQKAISMDHVLGERYSDVERVHPYENAQRLYYIVRNSTYLVVRRRLPIRFCVVQVVVFCGAYVSINGASSCLNCVLVVVRGVVDGLMRRMGRREYPLLQKGRR
jgi:rhamnosyltransferase